MVPMLGAWVYPGQGTSIPHATTKDPACHELRAGTAKEKKERKTNAFLKGISINGRGVLNETKNKLELCEEKLHPG